MSRAKPKRQAHSGKGLRAQRGSQAFQTHLCTLVLVGCHRSKPDRQITEFCRPTADGADEHRRFPTLESASIRVSNPAAISFKAFILW